MLGTLPSVRHWALLLALLLTGCTATSTTSTEPTTTPPATAATTVTTSPATTSPTVPDDTAPCLEGDTRFTEDGGAGVVSGSEGDATAIGQVSWLEYGPCERFIVSYRTSAGAPAVDPPTVATLFIRQSAVLRLNIGTSVTASAFKEQVVDSELVDGVFVVETPAGGLFVDMHLAGEAVARVTNQSGPARTVVDFRRGGSSLETRPLRAGDTIVVEPLSGDVRYPFSVSGYALGNQPQVLATLVSGDTSIEAAASIADRYDTWGAFTILFTDGPAGPITVQVGDVTLELIAVR